MQTVYYATSHYIRHEGNLVDLNEFRRKLSLSREMSLQAEQEELPENKPQIPLLPYTRKDHAKCFNRTAWVLDACASLGVIIMTLSFALTLFT